LVYQNERPLLFTVYVRCGDYNYRATVVVNDALLFRDETYPVVLDEVHTAGPPGV
jgi:hypothetical protein